MVAAVDPERLPGDEGGLRSHQVADGADDVDHDGWTNAQEVQRGPYWVQPFNPCLPDPTSPTCSLHPPFDNVYPPFRVGDMRPGDPIPLLWPR